MTADSVRWPRRVGVEEAYRFCRDLTERHYENFPVVTRLINPRQRNCLYAAYAFMRTADDMADQGTLAPEQRLHMLMSWQTRLDEAYRGKAEEPIFVALADAIHHANLPKEDFDNVLNAFKVDLFKKRYRTFDELLEYCRYSANPVGHIVLRVMGYGDDPRWPMMADASDKICTALQLVNHLQDVFVDQKKDRSYLPMEDMERFGYGGRDWETSTINDSFRSLMAFETQRAIGYFREGESLLSYLKPGHRRQIRLVLLGGERIAEKIVASRYDVLHHRPTITGYDKLRIALNFLLA